MRVLGRVLAVLAFVVLAAHFLRAGLLVPTAFALALPFLMLVRAGWAATLLRFVLLLATIEWARTALASSFMVAPT